MIDEDESPMGIEGSSKKQGRERKMTLKGEEHQLALLEKESKRRRKILTQTFGLFEDLLRVKDAAATKRELSNLQKHFADFQETTSRWMELSDESEKADIEAMFLAEKDGYDRLEGAVKDWIEEQSRVDGKSARSHVTRKSGKSGRSSSSKGSSRKKDEKTVKEKPAGGLGTGKVVEASEIIMKQLRLVEQAEVCEDLLKTEHGDMARKELRMLEDIFKEMEGISQVLSVRLPDEEMEKIKEILEKEGIRVSQVKVLVERKFPDKEDGVGSCHSHASKKSGQSKGRSRSGLSDTPFGRPTQELEQGRTEETNEILMTKYRKLEEQLKLCEDLPKGEDTMVVKRELSNLEDTLKEMKETMSLPREGVTEKEAREMEAIIIKGTTEVNRLKLSIEEISSKRNEDTESKGSHGSGTGHRNTSKKSGRGGTQLVSKALSNCSGFGRRYQVGEKTSQKSVRSLQSGRSGASKRSSCRTQEDDLPVEILTSQWTKTQERLENQRLHMKELFKMNDVDMMQRELNILEQIHQTLMTLSQRLSQNVLQERANEIFDQLIEHDETVFAMKKEVIRWMLTLEELDRRSSASRSSVKTGLSDNSWMSGGRKTKREKVKLSEENMRVQLEEEKAKLQHQKRQCSDVVGGNDTNEIRKEMKALDTIYRSASQKVTEIHELLPQLEADMMMEWAAAEEGNIFQLKQQMIKSMTTKVESGDVLEGEQSVIGGAAKPSPSLSIKDNVKETQGNHDIQPSTRKEVEDRARLEVDTAQERLAEQRDLIEHLLKADDREIMSQELETLDRVYDDMIAAASHLRKTLPNTEADEVSTMLDAQDNIVFKLKNKVANWMNACTKGPPRLSPGGETKDRFELGGNDFETRKEKGEDEKALPEPKPEVEDRKDSKQLPKSIAGKETEALKAEMETIKTRSWSEKEKACKYAKTQEQDKELAALRAEVESIKSDKGAARDKELADLRAEVEALKNRGEAVKIKKSKTEKNMVPK